MNDCHVHTHFSVDAHTPMQAYCVRALELGVHTLCFTDHVDSNPADDGFGFYHADAYFDELHRVQDVYAGRLRILAGMEFSEPHLYPSAFEALRKRPYDFIIGSVHYWLGDRFISEWVHQGTTAEESYAAYWPKALEAVRFGGFDCLGHIDFPKRYHKRLCLPPPDLLREIFTAMRANGVLLEVNTSSLRKGLDEPMPGETLLQAYAQQGFTQAYIGSDAHTPDELAAGVAQARALLARCGLSEKTP